MDGSTPQSKQTHHARNLQLGESWLCLPLSFSLHRQCQRHFARRPASVGVEAGLGFPEARLADGCFCVSYTGVDLKTPSEGRENMQFWSKDLLSTPHLKIEKLALNSPCPQDSPGTSSQGKQLVVCARCGRDCCPITLVAAEYCGSE